MGMNCTALVRCQFDARISMTDAAECNFCIRAILIFIDVCHFNECNFIAFLGRLEVTRVPL